MRQSWFVSSARNQWIPVVYAGTRPSNWMRCIKTTGDGCAKLILCVASYAHTLLECHNIKMMSNKYCKMCNRKQEQQKALQIQSQKAIQNSVSANWPKMQVVTIKYCRTVSSKKHLIWPCGQSSHILSNATWIDAPGLYKRPTVILYSHNCDSA